MNIIKLELLESLSHTMGGFVRSKWHKTNYNEIIAFELILINTSDHIEYLGKAQKFSYGTLTYLSNYDAHIKGIIAIYSDRTQKFVKGFYPYVVKEGKNIIGVVV